MQFGRSIRLLFLLASASFVAHANTTPTDATAVIQEASVVVSEAAQHGTVHFKSILAKLDVRDCPKCANSQAKIKEVLEEAGRRLRHNNHRELSSGICLESQCNIANGCQHGPVFCAQFCDCDRRRLGALVPYTSNRRESADANSSHPSRELGNASLDEACEAVKGGLRAALEAADLDPDCKQCVMQLIQSGTTTTVSKLK